MAIARIAVVKDGTKINVACRPNSAHADLMKHGCSFDEATAAMRKAYPRAERAAFDTGIHDSQHHDRFDSLDEAERAVIDRLGYSGARLDAWLDGWALVVGTF